MQVEIITKNEIISVEAKLDQVISLLKTSPIPGENNVYTTQELAKKLSVSTKTIQNWRDSMLIEYSQVGHKIYYTGKSVEEFLANHSIKRNGYRYSKRNFLINH
jgi:hypothetical protein